MPSHDQVEAAHAELARLHRQYPCRAEADLPPEAREAAEAAFRTIRASQRSPGVVLVLLALTAAGAALAIWAPPTCFSCARSGGGPASCAVSERPLGLFVSQARLLRPVGSATGSSQVKSEQRAKSSAKPSSIRFTVQGLRIADPEGASLYESSRSYPLGVGLPALAERIDALGQGQTGLPVVACVASWPPLLAATLFGLIGLTALVSELRPRWLPRPVEQLLQIVFLAAALLPWVLVLLGTGMPAWLVGLLGLGPPG